MGVAHRFTETLHPEGANNTLLVINATGELEEGRSFRLHLTLQEAKGHRLVQVRFDD